MVKAKIRILSIFHAFVAFWRMRAKGLFDPYRPELHYMRGPGPRWREKQELPDSNLWG